MNRTQKFCVVACAALQLTSIPTLADRSEKQARFIAPTTPRTLDGSANHPRDADRGKADMPFRRVSPVRYADDIAEFVTLPNSRYISNRIFNDRNQNLFSENAVTQWAAVWGQFIDHTIGLRDQGSGEAQPISFDVFDPLEEFQNDLGVISFTRTPAAPGTGVSSPREQLNEISSYIDGWAVYGGDENRLEWLREGVVDGDLSNNSGRMLLDDGYLPRATLRGDADAAPAMSLNGGLRLAPETRVVTGDVRANENIGLAAVQTLFAREHNRIVDSLPDVLGEEEKFQIARRVVGALQQHITYREFLPALGVRLPRYRGYRPGVDSTVTNEFAVVGYRAHSMIHGEVEIDAENGDYTAEQLDELRNRDIEVETDGEHVGIAVPLNVGFFNPDLVELLGLGSILKGLAGESQYLNDEQIDNQLRSIMFQIPLPGASRPSDCLDGENLAQCYTGVMDLGALDIERGRDHGIASYNDLRQTFGLRRVSSFTELTGEASAEFAHDLQRDDGTAIDNPAILDFESLLDIDGNSIVFGTDAAEGEAVSGIRSSTLAARLKAIYGSVDAVDAFVGMVSEPHVRRTEFGHLQLAIWKHQFRVLRDGDRYFYRNDPELRRIQRTYGVSARRSLADVIVDNTDVELSALPQNVFLSGSGGANPATRSEPPRRENRPGQSPHSGRTRR